MTDHVWQERVRVSWTAPARNRPPKIIEYVHQFWSQSRPNLLWSMLLLPTKLDFHQCSIRPYSRDVLDLLSNPSWRAEYTLLHWLGVITGITISIALRGGLCISSGYSFNSANTDCKCCTFWRPNTVSANHGFEKSASHGLLVELGPFVLQLPTLLWRIRLEEVYPFSLAL